MKKRIFALLLVMALLAAMISGCAGKAEQTPAESEAPAASEEAPAPSEETPAPAEETPAEGEAQPEESEGPVLMEPMVYPLCDEVTTLTYWQAWPPFLSTFCSPDQNETFAKLEEITNVHLEFTVVDTETQAEKFNLMVAADECTDIMQGATRTYTGGGTKAIEDEVIIDVWPYLAECMPDYYNRIIVDDNIRRYMLDDEGQMAQIYGLYSEPFYMDQGFWVRQDFLDKAGLEMPNTLDEIETVLETFKTDLGIEQPLVMLAIGRIDFLAKAYEAETLAIDGKLVDNTKTDNMKNYYKKVHEWYEKGYFAQDFLANSYSETKPPEEMVYQDKGGMFNEDVASISTYIKNSTNPDFELRAMPQILLTADQELHNCKIPYMVSDKYAMSISTNCSEENIPLALGMLNYMFTDDGEILGNYGIEGTTFTYDESGAPQFTDFIISHKLGLQGAQSAFINPGIPCLVNSNATKLTYNDAQMEAVDVWIKNFADYSQSAPKYSLTTEEQTEVATLQTDIETYTEEMGLKFITGEADIDAEWDTYLKTIQDLGGDTIAEKNQIAYERYLAK